VKSVLILGAGIFQEPAIQEAKKMGYWTCAADLDAEASGFAYADEGIVVSTKDIPGLIDVARDIAARTTLCGVFTAGTDAAYAVACVADALGLPGIRPQDAYAATNKFVMRERLSEHNVPCPNFMRATSLEEAIFSAEELGYPVVMKPVDNMGARGVRRLDSAKELTNHFNTALSFSGFFNDPAVIIEEYMSGPEISMDTIVLPDGAIHLLTIADRHIESEPCFIETGHSIPSLLPAEQLEEAFEVMKKAIRAIGITRGAAKADIKITPEGAKIGEVTARLSGGFHSQCTERLATGMNSTRAALCCALDIPVMMSDITPHYDRVGIERALIPEPGYIVNISGIEEAKALPGVWDIIMTKQVGDTVNPIVSNIGKAGHILVESWSREAAEAIVDKAKEHITFHMEEITCH